MKDIVHGDTDFGIPEKAFTQTYLANSHLPSLLQKPLHCEINTWETYRDVLKVKNNCIPGGATFARVEYGTPGTANDAVNAIGQRTETNYSGLIYPSFPNRQGKSEYAYNANGEVVSAVRKNASGTPLAGESDAFTFDPIGNRLVASIDGAASTTYQPNALNQYSQITTNSLTSNPFHDLDGNLVNDGSKRYVWDAENRLIEVRQATGDALIASYRYDYMSRRIHKETTALAPQGAGETVFHYEGWNLCAEYPAASNAIGTTTIARRTYTWGLDVSGSMQGAGGVGGLLAVEEKSGTLAWVRYPLYDGNGNVIGLIRNSGGTVYTTAAYEYDAFGNTVHTGGGYADEMPFRFSTKYFDKETGFYYYGYRHYDPVTGRWPSRDPIGESGGANVYGFIGNNPVDGFDLLGLVYPEVWRDGEEPPCKEPCHNIFLRIVAISGNTTRGDRRAWNKTGLQVIDENIDSNQELVDEVKKAYDEAGNAVPPCKKCITELHLSGHGAVGGVNWVNSETEYTNFDTSSIAQSQVDLLKGMLCDDGVLRLWSCSSAILPDAPGGIAAMTKLLGVKVSGIAGDCFNGPHGGSHDGVDVVWRGE